MPGHGARAREEFTVAAALEAIQAAVGELGPRAVLVGYSMGGFLVLEYAARHPESTAGVVGFGCTAVPTRWTLPVYRTLARVLAADPERGDRWSARAYRRLLPGPVAEAVVAGGIDCRVFPRVVDQLAGLDPAVALAAYPGPVWLVNGSRDQFRLNERRCLAACREGRLAVWPGYNHVTVLGETDRIVRTVADVCASVERR